MKLLLLALSFSAPLYASQYASQKSLSRRSSVDMLEVPYYEVEYDSDVSTDTSRVGIRSALAMAASVSFQQAMHADIHDDFFNAIMSESVEGMAQLLVTQRYDARLADEQGRTPLIWAAKLGKAFSIQFLLALGVDTKAKDHKGYTFLDYAYGKPIMMDAIENHNKKITQNAFCGDSFRVARACPQLQAASGVNQADGALFQRQQNAQFFQIRRYGTPEFIDISEKYEEKQLELQNRLADALCYNERAQIAELIALGADHTVCYLQEQIQSNFFTAEKQKDEEAKAYWVSLGADPNEIDPLAGLDRLVGWVDLQVSPRRNDEGDDFTEEKQTTDN